MPALQHNGVTTYYEVSGQGEPLVFVCGLSADLQVWRFQTAAFSQRYRMICYDHRGAGRSTAPEGPYALSDLLGDLVALLDHLQIARARVVGHSMGGLIAQMLAAEHPERVERLALIASFAAPDGLMRVAIRNWMAIRRSDMPWEEVVRYVSRWTFGPALAGDAAAYEAYVSAMVNNRHAQTRDGFIRQAQALFDAAAVPGLATVRAPTLVLAGLQDQLVPPYLSEQLAQGIEGSRLRWLPGAHSGFVEHPEPYNQAVLDFLAEPDAATAETAAP